MSPARRHVRFLEHGKTAVSKDAPCLTRLTESYQILENLRWPWPSDSKRTPTSVSSSRSLLKITYTSFNRLIAAGNDGSSQKPAANERDTTNAKARGTPFLS